MSRQAAGPHRARHADDSDADDNSADLGTLATIASDAGLLAAAEIDTELELCLRLREWDPWAEPSPELQSALHALRDHDVNRHGRGARCLLRVAAVEQLASEEVAIDQLPEWMKYHAWARYCLQKGRATSWGEQS